MTAYLDLVGNRLLDGFDISEPHALELPDAAAAGDPHRRREAPTTTRTSRRRPRCPLEVPEEHRPSSTSCSARRGSSTGSATSAASTATSGRRASCAAPRSRPAGGSRRPAASHPEHIVDAGLDEMRALLARAGGPSADELAARAEYRTTRTAKDAPPTLGPPPPPPPDPSDLPPGRGARDAATGIALGSAVRQLGGEHEEDKLRGLAASRGVYEGPRASSPGRRVRPDRQGRRPGHRVDHRGVQHPAAAARRDRDRQRRPALALGDRRARIRDPRRGRDARGHRAHPRRRARARRRRRRRGDGARREARPSRWRRRATPRSSGRRPSGSGDAVREGLPVPPGVALSGAIVEAVAAEDEAPIEKVAKAVRRSAGRSPSARPRSTRTAPTRASPAST